MVADEALGPKAEEGSVSAGIAYAGYCRCCGGMIAVASGSPTLNPDMAQDIKDFVDEGYDVRRVTNSEVRANFSGHKADCTVKD